jgi:hypothetical protein
LGKKLFASSDEAAMEMNNVRPNPRLDIGLHLLGFRLCAPLQILLQR